MNGRLRLVVVVALVGCASTQINAGYHPPARAAIALALAAPFPTPLQQHAFSSAFDGQPQISLLPALLQANIAQGEELRGLLSSLANPLWIWQRTQSIGQRLGPGGLATLQHAFTQADLLLVPTAFQLRQKLWHVMTGDFAYRLYDLHDGSFILQDELSLSVDTNPALGVDDLDEAAVVKILAHFGSGVRRQIEERALNRAQ